VFKQTGQACWSGQKYDEKVVFVFEIDFGKQQLELSCLEAKNNGESFARM
jgi:hypothetical protein